MRFTGGERDNFYISRGCCEISRGSGMECISICGLQLFGTTGYMGKAYFSEAESNIFRIISGSGPLI